MEPDQILLLLVLGSALGLFLWGRWRHDMVALGALLICVPLGLVPAESAFHGFGHPAVVTVASVLVLGHGLQQVGLVDRLARHCLPESRGGPTLAILALVSLAAALSGFMNNVGALALLMPVGIRLAARHDLPPGRVLMPLAFGSILGGMTTLIGTPPNLIVSGFRADAGFGAFGMFSFAPVGVSVAFLGALFVGAIGWRLVPARSQPGGNGFASGLYFSEVRIEKGSRSAGKRIADIEPLLDETGAQIVALVRNAVRIPTPNRRRLLRAGDILVIEVEPESLSETLTSLGGKLEEDIAPDEAVSSGRNKTDPAADGQAGDRESGPEPAESDEVALQEWVVLPDAALAGRSATQIDLRTRYGINLLALSRQGRRSFHRLRTARIAPGDVLLLQGPAEAIAGFSAEWGCLPLADRDIRVPDRRRVLTAVFVMASSIVATATGRLPAPAAFAAGALVYVATGIVPLRSAYRAIDWPVIVLLGAMLPVAEAMGTTGAADGIARALLNHAAQGHPAAALALLMILTILLSSLMNNAATAAVMCPVAIGAAHQLGVSPDPFLMAVAIGASCAFLTPISHQNNTLILGPGGFRFGDYWRLGLPLEALVVAVAVPLLLAVWPL